MYNLSEQFYNFLKCSGIQISDYSGIQMVKTNLVAEYWVFKYHLNTGLNSLDAIFLINLKPPEFLISTVLLTNSLRFRKMINIIAYMNKWIAWFNEMHRNMYEFWYDGKGEPQSEGLLHHHFTNFYCSFIIWLLELPKI